MEHLEMKKQTRKMEKKNAPQKDLRSMNLQAK